MSTQMTHYDAGSQLTNWREPEQVLAEAQSAAAALGRVIAMKKDPVIFNKEQYLEFEDWQTVGKFYGLTTKTVSTRYCEYGGVTGWEAEAICINEKTGVEVGRAESMCMTDEDNWGDVPVYKWEDILDENGKKIWDPAARQGKGGYKAQKVQVESKAKPMFQLRSMAQTRACAKAFRQVLSWVVVLGGFKPNVAEEMIESQLPPDKSDEPKKDAKPPVKQPQRASEVSTKEIEGFIETAKPGGKGSTWLSFKELGIVAVAPNLVDSNMKDGSFLSGTVKAVTNEKIGQHWLLTQLKECSLPKDAVIDGEIVEAGEPEEEDPTTKVYFKAEDEAQAAAEPAKQAEGIADLFASGAIKKGSELPEGATRKPGTIGEGRATVLKSTISKNAKRTGFTWDKFEVFKADAGWEHTRDMPIALWETFLAYANGTSDVWKRSFDDEGQ